MTTIIFETGATNEVTNELILYIDTTRELADYKFLIFKRVMETEHLYHGSKHPDMWKKTKVDLVKSLGLLYKKAKALYEKEFPTPQQHDHIKFFTQEQMEDFISVYKTTYKEWRKEQSV